MGKQSPIEKDLTFDVEKIKKKKKEQYNYHGNEVRTLLEFLTHI